MAMSQNTLFELMPINIQIDCIGDETSQESVTSVLLTEDVKALHDFHDALKQNCKYYYYPGYKLAIEMSMELKKILNDAWCKCKGNKETEIVWQPKYLDNALKNTMAYIVVIDKIVTSDNFKVRYSNGVRKFLIDAKAQLERIETGLTYHTPS